MGLPLPLYALTSTPFPIHSFSTLGFASGPPATDSFQSTSLGNPRATAARDALSFIPGPVRRLCIYDGWRGGPYGGSWDKGQDALELCGSRTDNSRGTDRRFDSRA